MQTIHAGTVVYTLPGSEDAVIYWGTGRGSFYRGGKYYEPGSAGGDDDESMGVKISWNVFVYFVLCCVVVIV